MSQRSFQLPAVRTSQDGASQAMSTPRRFGDLGRHVDVEADVLPGLLVQGRLRRVGRVGGDDELAAVADLGEQVVGRVGGGADAFAAGGGVVFAGVAVATARRQRQPEGTHGKQGQGRGTDAHDHLSGRLVFEGRQK